MLQDQLLHMDRFAYVSLFSEVKRSHVTFVKFKRFPTRETGQNVIFPMEPVTV